jgi:hypothetical protein
LPLFFQFIFGNMMRRCGVSLTADMPNCVR